MSLLLGINGSFCARFILLAGLLAITGAGVVKAQELDYRAQSLFIYKFTRYVYWPAERTEGSFRIGVMGDSPIVEELEIMASLKKAGNDQEIEVVQLEAEDAISDLHLLYVASSQSREIKAISEAAGSAPVLIVAERSGLARKGAVISFIVTDEGILKFEINLEALEARELDIADELLRLGFPI